MSERTQQLEREREGLLRDLKVVEAEFELDKTPYCKKCDIEMEYLDCIQNGQEADYEGAAPFEVCTCYTQIYECSICHRKAETRETEDICDACLSGN